MFLSSSYSSKTDDINYHVPPIKDQENQNVSVCLGNFSGSGAEYNMYKANCFDLMVSKCSSKWTSECDIYISNTNSKQAELFINTVASHSSVPVTSQNSCKLTGFPNIETERIVMGMNTFKTEDNTYMPMSCYQSTFLEQKKKSLIKNQEHEERKRKQRIDYEERMRKRMDMEKVIIEHESPDSVHNKPIEPIHKQPTVTNQNDFYTKITNVEKDPSCKNTCDVSKMV